jgi:hypothetical protein
MPHLLRSLLVAVFAFAACSAQAQWRLITETDAMTDRQMKIAFTYVSGFGGVGLYRVQSGEVRMNLRVGLPDSEKFAVEPVMIRFDKHPAHTLPPPFNAASITDYSDGRWQPRSIEVQVWDGRGAPRSNAFINQLLTSSRALVRFTRSDGSIRDLTINLDGSANVVQQALALERSAQTVGEPDTEYKPTAWSTSIKRCREGPDMQACILKFTACYADYRGNDDLLLACAQR